MGTYIVGGLLVVAVAGALAKMRKDKKNSACGGGCSGCGSAPSCPSMEKK